MYINLLLVIVLALAVIVVALAALYVAHDVVHVVRDVVHEALKLLRGEKERRRRKIRSKKR